MWGVNLFIRSNTQPEPTVLTSIEIQNIIFFLNKMWGFYVPAALGKRLLLSNKSPLQSGFDLIKKLSILLNGSNNQFQKYEFEFLRIF